tara:strand:+ start:156 stop:311 length:156 start_codon:yes stop_codon:yes gene_type:complete
VEKDYKELKLSDEEIRKLSSVLSWVKVGLQHTEEELLMIEKILFKLRRLTL